VILCALASCAPRPDADSASAEFRTPPNLPPVALDPERVCPDSPAPRTVEIRQANPLVDKQHHDQMRQLLIDSVAQANTTVLLGPTVELDFSDMDESVFPIRLGPCVTLASGSVAKLPDITVERGRLHEVRPPLSLTAIPSRTPSSPGPLLRFGAHRSVDKSFLGVSCSPNEWPTSDNVTISGFRLFGPSFDQQDVDDVGITVDRCLNVEISNMEIAGWGSTGIEVRDSIDNDAVPGIVGVGPGQEQPNNLPGDRQGRADQVRIFHNYIHHNQHPRDVFEDHTAGYGAAVGEGGLAHIFENVFDSNRHAIAANGKSGGYDAERNLVLKGGGVHWDLGTTIHTHQFDIHGTGPGGKGDQASNRVLYADNSFQYDADNAIFVRGHPGQKVVIRDNIFPHEGFENDWGNDAVQLYYRNDLDYGSVVLGPNNTIQYDSYGKYGSCDFDGDGVDDVFLATGRTWWFSSRGEFPWTYLTDRHERIDQVRLGYFDGDQKCDVLTESGGQWWIASGGTGAWQSIGAYGAPLGEVAFGRFDPSVRDHRAGVTKQTTHAFWRTPAGEWKVTTLTGPAWQYIGGSSYPMSALRFGDFTGDGVTDVLAVSGGHWSISESGRSPWRQLNANLADPVAPLLIADLDNDGIDDLIKLEVIPPPSTGTQTTEQVTWWVSQDGTGAWRQLKTYSFVRPLTAPLPLAALAGRFGLAPGGGVLLVDHARMGRFFSEAEASPDWTSQFAY
jgi:hypothetical protein